MPRLCAHRPPSWRPRYRWTVGTMVAVPLQPRPGGAFRLWSRTRRPGNMSGWQPDHNGRFSPVGRPGAERSAGDGTQGAAQQPGTDGRHRQCNAVSLPSGAAVGGGDRITPRHRRRVIPVHGPRRQRRPLRVALERAPGVPGRSHREHGRGPRACRLRVASGGARRRTAPGDLGVALHNEFAPASASPSSASSSAMQEPARAPVGRRCHWGMSPPVSGRPRRF